GRASLAAAGVRAPARARRAGTHAAPRHSRLAARVSAAEGFVHRFEPGGGAAALLLLHGTGGDENQLVGLGRQLAPEAALLSPRGQVLEDGVAPRFFARRGIGVLDLDDLRAKADDLAAWVHAACVYYERDVYRVIA